MPLFKPRRLEVLNEVKISADCIRENFALFRKLLPDCFLFPVLKANAYGHGSKQIARILENSDAPYFALNSFAEASELRKVTTKRFLILGASPPANYRHYDYERIAVSICNLESLWAVAAVKKPVSIHLKLNSGMNRQGFDADEIPAIMEVLKKHPQLDLEGVFFHLADADSVNNIFTRKQENQFGKMLDAITANGFSPKYIHVGATAGCLKTTDPRINSCRPGIGIYGFNPLLPDDPYFSKLSGLKPALSLHSTIINVHRLQAGETVSYNCTYTAPGQTGIGVIPLGYFEALDRRLSNNGFIKYAQNFYSIAGRVCMNLTCFACPPDSLRVGDIVTVISDIPTDRNSIENIAKQIGTIPYEVLTGIERNIRRTII